MPMVWSGSGWFLGRYLRARRAYTTQLEDRADRLEHEREEEARRAIAAERARIARELHDIVAHAMSVVVLQAGSRRLGIGSDGRRAAQ